MQMVASLLRQLAILLAKYGLYLNIRNRHSAYAGRNYSNHTNMVQLEILSKKEKIDIFRQVKKLIVEEDGLKEANALLIEHLSYTRSNDICYSEMLNLSGRIAFSESMWMKGLIEYDQYCIDRNKQRQLLLSSCFKNFLN